MKNILNLSLILVQIILFISCKNSITKNLSTIKNVVIDTVATGDPSEIKFDTIIKVSKPFELNGILCYWENHIVYQEENVSEINVKLKNCKNKQIVLETPVDIKDSVNYKSDEYFENLNNDYFEDFNFDGFKDFNFFSRGSSMMTSLTNIYLFNNQTKTFEYSEYLSATIIEEIDEKSRKLVTEDSGMDYGKTKTHYFDKSGKIKYTVEITEYFDRYHYKIYEKIINGEVVKRDSIFISKE